MKKLMIVLMMSMGVVGSASAWRIAVKNYTPQSVQFQIRYGGKGVCSTDTVTMVPWTHREINAKFCCAKNLRIKPTSGPKAGQWETFTPFSYTGAGISCTSNRIVIKENPDHTLSVEQRK